MKDTSLQKSLRNVRSFVSVSICLSAQLLQAVDENLG